MVWGKTVPCEQWEQRKPQRPAPCSQGSCSWSTNGAGRSRHGHVRAPTGAAWPMGTWLLWLLFEAAGLAAALSLVLVTRLNFHPRLFSCSGVAVLAFLLRNADLFGWMLDGQMESYASECSEPTFRNTARSGCHS